LGTSTDLARYNGFEFESNPTGDSLPSDFVRISYQDSEGRLWFGHNNGSISVLENNKLTIIDNKEIRTRITGIAPDNEGNILISSQQQLLIVDKDLNTIIHEENITSSAITSIAVTDQNELLVGTFQGLYSFRYSTGSEPAQNSRIRGIPEVAVSDIRSLGDKGIFVGTRGQGLFHMVKEDNGVFNITNIVGDQGLGSATVETVYLDDDDNIWAGTMGQGVFKISGLFDNDGKYNVTRYTTANGLPANIVYGVFQDTEGNYWFNTNNGLSMLKDESFSFLRSFDEPFGNNVLSVYSDNENIWLGGESGLLRISADNSENQFFFSTGRGLPFDMVTAVTSCSDKNIWIGTSSSGIYKIGFGDERATAYHVSANSLDNIINDLEYNNGYLRAATSNGVLEFNLQTNERKHYTTNEGLPHNFIRDIFTDEDGTTWIATRSNGLVDIEDRRSARITSAELDFVAVRQDHNGKLWTATSGNGILKIGNDSIVQLTTDEGMHANFCYSMIVDSSGDIWVGHRLGVSRINPVSYLVRTYGTKNSIRGDFNYNSSYINPEGVLQFGTTEGLVMFDPSRERVHHVPPRLDITSIQISDEEYDITGQLALPYGSYKVRIEFIGLNYSNPEGVRYQYKLEGYDLDWSDLSEFRFAYYPRLDDGNFKFLLRAINEEGISTETPLSLVITIDKPIWKKWYFFVFVIVMGGLIFFIIVKIRERNLKLEKERIEKELAIRTREVIEQKAEIEHKNKDITDSINYAQRIQASILPPITKIEENFADSFVFYQPRDIVSGDFYWFDKVNENKFLIVCADSTGHGVPGAFMSMIGTTLIKDICMRKDVSSPSEVLETLDSEITSTLNQNVDPTSKSTDGMDITVCELDLKTRYFRFSSAMRPIMMLHKGELAYIRGSRSSIGGYYTEVKEFTNQGYQLDPGDIIYLFSDGYPDQFGGPLGKKFILTCPL
jgi:ligand-binding sensor domain-containing protein